MTRLRRGAAGDLLRQRAEKRLARKKAVSDERTDLEARRLLHELQVHEVELELQNEALREARQEQEAALERYMELFAFAPIGYFVVEGQDAIREVNHVGASLLGRERARIVGRPLNAFVVPEDQASLLALLRGARESGETLRTEVDLGDERGTRTRAALTANILPRDLAILVSVRDVTERRANEKRLTQVEAALREADRRKDAFLATLSHELRNPLAPIRNSLMFLSTRAAAKSAARTKAARAVITRQVAHLSRLIDDLLDVTRIEHGKIHLRLGEVELRRLLRGCARDQDAGFSRRGVSLETRLGQHDLWVRGDPTRLSQAISNVLGNALKFSKAGGHVTLGTRRAGGRVEITIRDDGAGIDPGFLPYLFEPFSQGPQPSARSWGGMGLGLPMVKGLVELHEGQVAVTSEGLGRGTLVTVLLPLIAAPRALPERGVVLSKTRRPRKILVIDDNADAADSLQVVLETVGHEVRVGRDGSSGIALAKRHRPEVVLCDIGLPDVDGYAVARALRAEPALAGLSLIALTGYGRAQDVEKALKSGFDRHLTKPPDFEQLLALLEQAPSHGLARSSGRPRS